ncbi:hypothetical protein ACEQ8H_008931 [Pleosporales sp. CAS-2024a]
MVLHILLTGGARGIGRGLFRHLLQAGHSVVMLDSNISELEHVRTLAEKWAATSEAKWTAIECDFGKRSAIKEAVATVKLQHFNGQLDVLINNAFPTDLTLSE